MITIRTRDYTTEQLEYLVAGLNYAANRIYDGPECKEHTYCTTDCKSYAVCHDVGNTRQYIWKKDKGA